MSQKGHPLDRLANDGARGPLERAFDRWTLSDAGQDVGAALWEAAIEHEKEERSRNWWGFAKPAPWRAPE